jgi:hypothetical protein
MNPTHGSGWIVQILSTDIFEGNQSIFEENQSKRASILFETNN